MALAVMASYKAASTCRVAKCAAEDQWLLNGNLGPVIDPVLWKRLFNGIRVYKGTTFKEKSAILTSQVREDRIYYGERRTFHHKCGVHNSGGPLWSAYWVETFGISRFYGEKSQQDDIALLPQSGWRHLGFERLYYASRH